MYAAIGAHIYAGGFTAGVSQHFRVLAHLEHAAYGSEVVKLNYPELPIYAGGPDSWPKSWVKRGDDRPRFLFANPPCAIWSGASHGRAGRWQDDPRLQYHHDIFNYALGVVAPEVFALESVPPSFVRGREHVDFLIEKADKQGYATTIVKHNAKWLGVAQNRSRIFYVFHKIAIPWEHPEFTTPMTVRQALKGIKKKNLGYNTTMSAKYLELVRQAAPGESLAKVFARTNPIPSINIHGKVVGRPSFLDSRSPWDKPNPVVIGGKTIHPEENRFMSQQEVAAICGFDQSYRWPSGNCGTITGYMSRGVMPPVGAWLAENVSRAIDNNRRLNQVGAFVLDVTKPPGVYIPL